MTQLARSLLVFFLSRGSHIKLNEVPDTHFRQICQTNCCDCAESARAALSIQAKNRTFTIQGSISVLERALFAVRERAAEKSESFAQKDTVCVMR